MYQYSLNCPSNQKITDFLKALPQSIKDQIWKDSQRELYRNETFVPPPEWYVSSATYYSGWLDNGYDRIYYSRSFNISYVKRGIFFGYDNGKHEYRIEPKRLFAGIPLETLALVVSDYQQLLDAQTSNPDKMRLILMAIYNLQFPPKLQQQFPLELKKQIFLNVLQSHRNGFSQQVYAYYRYEEFLKPIANSFYGCKRVREVNFQFQVRDLVASAILDCEIQIPAELIKGSYYATYLFSEKYGDREYTHFFGETNMITKKVRIVAYHTHPGKTVQKKYDGDKMKELVKNEISKWSANDENKKHIRDAIWYDTCIYFM